MDVRTMNVCTWYMKWVEFVGRWSMFDVFVIAVLSAMGRIGQLMSVYTGNRRGVVPLVVILTMFTAMTFDPCLLWDHQRNNDQEGSAIGENNYSVANVEAIKRWSSVWIVPIVTVLIGSWILFYHFSHLGPRITLTTQSAEGIVAGKTTIKSRSVGVGVVESVVLSDDLRQGAIVARLHSGMGKLLCHDSVFWVMKPQIGREGISGLGTLLSGAFIELQPGMSGEARSEFALLDSPPVAPPHAKGIRILLDRERSGQLNAGDPVLFRGYRVGFG